MKAKNVRKHVGKEVVLKVTLDKVTNFGGYPLTPAELGAIDSTTLSILDGVVSGNGDVRIRNGGNNVVFVHHKFIKLKREPKTDVETNISTLDEFTGLQCNRFLKSKSND